MAENHSAEQAVVAGMLAGGVPVIDEVCTTLSERHFSDPVARELFVAVRTYRGVASGVLTEQALADLQRDAAVDAGSAALAVETYQALCAAPVGVSDTRWAVSRVRADRERSDTAAALSDATEIATGSVTDSEGKTWTGPTQAREWAQSRFAEIEADSAGSEALGADVRTEARAILDDYAALHAARERGVSDGRPRFGIESLDQVCEGLGKGELSFLAGPTGEGKSQLCVALTHHAVVMQGLHVFFATSETLRGTVRARLIARHSRCEHFAEAREAARAPEGLDSRLIEHGTLPAEQLPLFQAVVMDLCNDPEQHGYGHAHISQVGHGATVRSIAAQAAAADRQVPVDLIVVDYLALLASERRRSEAREEKSSVLIDAKRLATTFRSGEGVPVVSPWQLTRAAQEEVARTGSLELRGLAETAETERSADTVVVLLADGARDRNRYQGMRVLVPKNRDGQVRVGDDALAVRMDYATSYVTDRASSSAPDAVNGHVGTELDSLVGGWDSELV